MAKKILLTGGSGFIGNNLARAMLAAGYHVRVLDNDSRGSRDRLDNLKGNIEIVTGDIRNAKTVRDACSDIDGIIHLAAVNGTKFFYSMPEVVLDVAVRGMLNIIDASLWHGVEELYFASSSEVYQVPDKVPTSENVRMIVPDPYNPRYSYAGGKIISELLLLNYGKKYFRKAVVFRPHNVFGPDMGWEHVIPQFIIRLKRLLDNYNGKSPIKFPIQGSGEETRSFIYIDDFVRAFMILLKKGKHMETYNVGTSQEISIEKVANLVAKHFKVKIQIVPGKLAVGGTTRRLPDIKKIKKLGFAPKVGLSQGISMTASWYNDNIHKIPASEII